MTWLRKIFLCVCVCVCVCVCTYDRETNTQEDLLSHLTHPLSCWSVEFGVQHWGLRYRRMTHVDRDVAREAAVEDSMECDEVDPEIWFW